MERLVDDCIIMDYGKILIQKPITELLEKGRRYTFTIPEGYELPASDDLYHPSIMRNQLETFSFDRRGAALGDGEQRVDDTLAAVHRAGRGILLAVGPRDTHRPVLDHGELVHLALVVLNDGPILNNKQYSNRLS